MSSPRQVAGTVIILFCAICKKKFPGFRFVGDEDTESVGLGVATSCEKNEVVVAALTPDEWRAQKTDGLDRFEKRIASELGRGDLRVVRLLRVEQQEQFGEGISFKEFRKKYVRPKLIFSCACCDGGESAQVDELTVEEFRKLGGKVSAIGSVFLSEKEAG